MSATNAEMKKHYDLNELGSAEVGKHYKAYTKGRGVQKNPTKVAISIRLDNDVIDAFKAQGKGWQTQINNILRESVLGS